MLYYYAYSGHKYGLDRVRRGVALIKALKAEGVEMRLLVNDFRAGLAAKELGVEGAVTVETLLDVDAVAERGNGVVLDTPEDTAIRLEQYADRFTPLFVVSDESESASGYGEILLKPFCEEEENCIETPLVDRDYSRIPEEKNREKEDRPLFIFGDADYNKEILKHREFFEDFDMDLLLGYYFFVKYESELSELFHQLYEPEEYSELLEKRSRVLSASLQSALEAKAAGADVAYIRRGEEPVPLLRQLERYDIKIIDGYNKEQLSKWLELPSGTQKGTRIPDNIYKAVLKKLNL